MIEGRISSLADGIAFIENMRGVALHSVVHVGKAQIPGTVIAINGDAVKVQLFDDWQNVRIGDRAISDNIPLSVELGPGLIGHTFDALLRPIGSIDKNAGALNKRKRWNFVAQKTFGDRVCSGEIIGYVRETLSVKHAITVPLELCGTIVELNSGNFKVNDRIGKIKKDDGTIIDLSLLQRHNLHTRRESARLAPSDTLLCGILATDAFFPIESGGSALIVGDTTSAASDLLARLTLGCTSDVNVVVLFGKSMNVIHSRLNDYKKIVAQQKTVFILSTQDDRYDMRVKALETATAVAEYFRETGLNVLLSIDSLDAVLELETKNAPLSYLTELFKRAARTQGLSRTSSDASLTIVAAVSPSLIASAEQIKQCVGTCICLDGEAHETARDAFDLERSFSKSLHQSTVAEEIMQTLISLSGSEDKEISSLAGLALKALLSAELFATRAKDKFYAQILESAEKAFFDRILALCRDARNTPDKCRQSLKDIFTLCDEITPQ